MRNITHEELFAPSFYQAWNDIVDNKYSEYWFKGGRGSGKSSFISLVIVIGIIQDPQAHACIFRKVGADIRNSVFNQVMWAIRKLGLQDFFQPNLTSMKIVYKPTGQTILFRGLDDQDRTKSIKAPFGYFKYLWFEELSQFNGIPEVRSVKQSVLRGGHDFQTFCSYNPPMTSSEWVNAEAAIPIKGRHVYSSTYLEVPTAWLGKDFFEEAKALKEQDERAYRHEYLGECTGTGGTVFRNLIIRSIGDDEISHFCYPHYGIDWGFAIDPFVFVSVEYDAKRKLVYIYDEIFQVGLSNEASAELVAKKETNYEFIRADCAEPKSIDDFQRYGINCIPCEKGKDSINHGIQWLQGQRNIIIDPFRCPNAAREFSQYEYKRSKNGDFISAYPDKNNHTIDAVRYAMEEESSDRGLF